MSPRNSDEQEEAMFIRRFWAKVRRTAGCWIWVPAEKRRLYGQIYYKGQYHSTHRVSWRLAKMVRILEEIRDLLRKLNAKP